jgi:hypothetical protein
VNAKLDLVVQANLLDKGLGQANAAGVTWTDESV